jgi:hypothetical protein
MLVCRALAVLGVFVAVTSGTSRAYADVVQVKQVPVALPIRDLRPASTGPAPARQISVGALSLTVLAPPPRQISAGALSLTVLAPPPRQISAGALSLTVVVPPPRAIAVGSLSLTVLSGGNAR